MVRRDLLDELDRRILSELRRDSRVSRRALARRLGVTAPTVAHRIRRMEEARVITGYTVVTSIDASDLTSPRIPPLICHECKGRVRGPSIVRRMEGRALVFCCTVCEERFDQRRRRLGAPTSQGLVVVVLVGLAVHGAWAAACLGLGACPAPAAMPHLRLPCPEPVPLRDETPWLPVAAPRRRGDRRRATTPGGARDGRV